MRKFHCLLFVLKRSHICYYIICMTVPLTNLQNSQRKHLCQSLFFNKVGGWKPKTVRSSLWKCSVKKGALKNFMWKHLCWSLFLITLHLAGPATLLKKTPIQVLSFKICKFFRKSYFGEHL